ncbi:MAG: lipid-A-disaccharide synthase [Candidatus Omnitrophica bacterium]|nr:lipid-A-disaccharide synthase [Candidatus Omnitrophota bacterium]MDD5690327.1 lipid-A-disaccharide synthase [Candidatus Omnitrophota bacterium]
MAQIKKIFIVCGEPSGDLLSGDLIQEIRKLNPEIQVSGVGGSYLRKSGAEIFYDIKDLSVMGFFDVLKKLPKFFKLKRAILEKINTDAIDAIIFVDFSGFNLRLAKAINKRIPTIYYVSPQVWASRENRVGYIRDFISRIIVLFKFEEEFYKQRKIKAHCVGHPLINLVHPSLGKQELLKNLQINPSQKVIALLPGSRKQEIKMILPLMLKAAQLINKEIPNTQFVIAKSPNLNTLIYQKECKKYTLNLKIIDGKTYDCLNIADFCLVCSGTATLETAIMQRPFVIVYKMDLLNYLLYRPQIKIPYVGMVNIVAGKEVVPEFIQFNARPEMIARAVLEFLRKPGQIKQMLEDLDYVKTNLGSPGAAERAAKLILDFLQNK